MNEEELFAILEVILQQLEALNGRREGEEVASSDNDTFQQLYDYQNLSENEVTKLIEQENSVDLQYVEKISFKDYQELLENNNKRHQFKDPSSETKNCSSNHEEKKNENIDHIQDGENDAESPLNPLQELIINSVCSPRIIDAIRTEFFKRRNNHH